MAKSKKDDETTPNVSGTVQDQPEATRSGSVVTSVPSEDARREEQK